MVDGPGRPNLHREGLRGRHQREEGSERAVGDHLLLGGLPLADHGVLRMVSLHLGPPSPPAFLQVMLCHDQSHLQAFQQNLLEFKT